MGPQAIFGAKSIFRLCLFLDIWIMFYELQDAICGWLVKSEKNIWTSIFRRIGWNLFLDCQSKNRYVEYY